MDFCPICNGRIQKNSTGDEECEKCATTFKTPTKERIEEIISKRYAKISKEIWGR